MSSDLERFLQQAAERLKDKIQQGQQSTGKQSKGQQRPPPTPPPVRQKQRSSSLQDRESQVIQASVAPRREMGDDPLSTIDTRPSVAHELRDHLAEEVAQADERMLGHMHQVFDHTVSRLPEPSNALQSNVSKTPDQTNEAVEVNRRGRMSSPFLRMLRKPDTLRAAFIAGEIFRRKF